MMDWTTLVRAEDVAATLGEPGLRIVDARFVLAGADTDVGERAWREAHVPGAGYVHLDRDLSDHSRPKTEGRHPMPSAQAFTATLERLGITPETQVVVYDGADGAMAAARFWWLLKLLGHVRVAVMDGGFARWTALDLPLETQEPISPRGSYPGDFDHCLLVADAEVARRLQEQKGWLLDARAAERFRGDVEPLDRVAGHIPGAVNRPYAANLSGGVFRDAETLRREFEQVIAGRKPREVILSCGSGVTACHNLLAMEHAGLHGARVYAGSWSGWISDPSHPVATGD